MADGSIAACKGKPLPMYVVNPHRPYADPALMNMYLDTLDVFPKERALQHQLSVIKR